MDQKEIMNNDEVIEIDLKRIFDALVHKAWLVVIVSTVTALLTMLITFFFITPEYEAKAMFYVNNNSLSVGNASLSISSGDLTTSRNLVESYLVILNTWETLEEVIDYSGVDVSIGALEDMISAEAVNETEIFSVVITSTSPQEAERLANAIAHILPKRIDTIIEGTSAKIVSAALVPSRPSSPSYAKNTIIGFLLGFVAVAGVIVLQTIYDTTIYREEDVVQISKLPILASVPDMLGESKGGYYYYGQKRRNKEQKSLRDQDLVSEDIPFTATEAYKLLRAKIQYSFSDDKQCHVVGVSSALSGEGKSTTSINLSRALAQLDKKVLLVDCDLRRPSVATKLGLRKEHGLSDYLTKHSKIEQVLQQCQMKHGGSFSVVSAGKIPPNPTELLNSPRMEYFIEKQSNNYDYIILDLPPVEEVSDALVAAKLADGVLLAVRQDYCNRVALKDTIHQFEFINGRILGLLMTCATDSGAGYGPKYYKRYYRRYGRKYHYARVYEEKLQEQKPTSELK